jgi:KDO2-lipid IV(A) lauroyltransferase
MVEKKQTRSSPALARLAIAFLRAWSTLPLSWARAFGGIVGRVAYLIPARPRRITERNVTHCLGDQTADRRTQVIRRSLIETAKTYAEFGAMWEWPPEKLHRLERQVDNAVLLEDALAERKGVILLVPHIGNWEFLLHYLMRCHGITALYRPPRIKELDEHLSRSRQRSGATLVPPSGAGLRSLLSTLSEGRLVGILPDQEPLKDNGVFAPFFGYPALTMTLVASLVRRYGSRVVYGYASRCPGGFRIRFREAPEGLDDPDDVAAATQLNRGVENCVRECPEQYLWSYKRFRTRRIESQPEHENELEIVYPRV